MIIVEIRRDFSILKENTIFFKLWIPKVVDNGKEEKRREKENENIPKFDEAVEEHIMILNRH